MSTFKTNPWDIDQLLSLMDTRKIVLPEFQRSFVWWPKDIDLLITSLVQDYPAGSLLFLRADGTSELGFDPRLAGAVLRRRRQRGRSELGTPTSPPPAERMAQNVVMAVDHLDSGVVTLMFTDVEGSTALTRRVGDEVARRAIESHRRIVREAIGKHGGREIDSIGDGFMITFLSTRQAISCAVAIQKTLEEHGREHPEEDVRVRIGLNVGEVLERGGHPFGAAVNATQRVAGHAKGGQILVSEPVRHLAGTIPDVTFRDRGRSTLKGFSERWRLYEVVWQPAREKAPPKPKEAHARRRLPYTLAGAAAAAAVLAVGTFALLSGGTSKLDRVTPNSVGIVDTGDGDILGQVPVGSDPVDIAADPQNQRLWVASLGAGTISEIDPKSRAVVDTSNAGERPRSLAAGEGFVWVANQFVDKLSIFDPRRGGVTDTIDDLHGPKDVAVGFGAAWVALATDRSVIRIDAGTKANQRIAAGTSVAVGPKAVWVADGAKVVPIDPETLHAGTPITLRFTADQLAVGDDGTVWATHTADDAVSRIDAADGSVQTISRTSAAGPRGSLSAKAQRGSPSATGARWYESTSEAGESTGGFRSEAVRGQSR